MRVEVDVRTHAHTYMDSCIVPASVILFCLIQDSYESRLYNCATLTGFSACCLPVRRKCSVTGFGNVKEAKCE